MPATQCPFPSGEEGFDRLSHRGGELTSPNGGVKAPLPRTGPLPELGLTGFTEEAARLSRLGRCGMGISVGGMMSVACPFCNCFGKGCLCAICTRTRGWTPRASLAGTSPSRLVGYLPRVGNEFNFGIGVYRAWRIKIRTRISEGGQAL
jgi:hypothetical protein